MIEEVKTWEYGITAVFTLGESEPATLIVVFPATMGMIAACEFTPNAMVHNTHIPEAIL